MSAVSNPQQLQDLALRDPSSFNRLAALGLLQGVTQDNMSLFTQPIGGFSSLGVDSLLPYLLLLEQERANRQAAQQPVVQLVPVAPQFGLPAPVPIMPAPGFLPPFLPLLPPPPLPLLPSPREFFAPVQHAAERLFGGGPLRAIPRPPFPPLPLPGLG